MRYQHHCRPIELDTDRLTPIQERQEKRNEKCERKGRKTEDETTRDAAENRDTEGRDEKWKRGNQLAKYPGCGNSV